MWTLPMNSTQKILQSSDAPFRSQVNAPNSMWAPLFSGGYLRVRRGAWGLCCDGSEERRRYTDRRRGKRERGGNRERRVVDWEEKTIEEKAGIKRWRLGRNGQRKGRISLWLNKTKHPSHCSEWFWKLKLRRLVSRIKWQLPSRQLKRVTPLSKEKHKSEGKGDPLGTVSP